MRDQLSRRVASIGRAVVAAAACGLAGLTPGLRAAGGEELTVDKGRVAVICPLTIGGRFEAKSTAVTGRITVSPGSDALDGSFSVDLRNLDTGIALRNTHLRDNYLEVARGQGYDAAVLDKITLPGSDASRAQGKVAFRGMLTLHGRAREVQGTADIARGPRALTLKVEFPLQIDAFEIAKPTYLGVGVANDIRVQVHATLVTSAPAKSPSD